MSGLKDKVVLITGAASGLGAATAEYFAEKGSLLSLTDIGSLDAVVKRLREHGVTSDRILTTTGDITSRSFQKQLIQQTVAKFGRLDVLDNNAGIGPVGTVEEQNEAEFDRVFEVNSKAPVFLTQEALPYLERTKGSIINIVSIVSRMVLPGFGAYGASKAYLEYYTKTMAVEFASKGVRVNSVHPGVVETPLYKQLCPSDKERPSFLKHESKSHPLGRTGTPRDIAQAVVYLASDEAAFITGNHLFVSGGRELVFKNLGEVNI